MKQVVFSICALCVYGFAYAETSTIDWKVGNTTYDTTTCTVGGDINLPNAPTKTGYRFVGWLSGTPVEYLQSSGTQWIDTGIVPTVSNGKISDQIEIDFMPLLKQSAGVMLLRTWGIGVKNDGYFNFVVGVTPTAYTVGQRYKIFIKNGQQSINGQIIGTQTLPTSYLCSLTLFGLHPSDGSCQKPSSLSTIRIYSVKIWTGTNRQLVGDFIPVLDSDGVAAMYNKVTDTFHYNGGTGTFTTGPVLN